MVEGVCVMKKSKTRLKYNEIHIQHVIRIHFLTFLKTFYILNRLAVRIIQTLSLLHYSRRFSAKAFFYHFMYDNFHKNLTVLDSFTELERPLVFTAHNYSV